jgi:sorting nexin-4
MLENAQDYSELGAALNGYSLNESGALAAAMEKTGQAVDTTYMSTTRLVRLPLPVQSHASHSFIAPGT